MVKRPAQYHTASKQPICKLNPGYLLLWSPTPPCALMTHSFPEKDPSSHLPQIHFLKQGCGEDKICQSNLQLVHARFCARVSDTEFQPLPM